MFEKLHEERTEQTGQRGQFCLELSPLCDAWATCEGDTASPPVVTLKTEDVK